MRAGVHRAAFVVFLVINCILWRHSRYSIEAQHSKASLTRRIFSRDIDSDDDIECAPLDFPVADQCAHAQHACPKSETVLSIPYLQSYFCSTPSARPAMFSGLVVWSLFLFSTLGISASDFFCPNLATLAELLRLDETVAGVTFLAFGNGSPDVFSTFSAMKVGSGSLAIGELLGAASFIVSCVAGSMCIIKPFKVDAIPFIRDVGFFTTAIALLLVILWDGLIHAWEAGILILLYIFYVCVVVVGTWWDKRRMRRRALEATVRSEYLDDVPSEDLLDVESYRDDPGSPRSTNDTLAVPSANHGPRLRTRSEPNPPVLTVNTQLERRSRSPSPSGNPSNHLSHMPSFSLVGALEFRQVINSLQRQASTSALEMFEGPLTPYVGGHYHIHHTFPRSPRAISTTRSLGEINPFEASLGVPLDERRSPSTNHLSLQAPPIQATLSTDTQNTLPSISITHTPTSPLSEGSVDETVRSFKPLTKRERFVRATKNTAHVLFPTLQNFKTKSFLGMIASVLAAPAVLALTITLPVLVTPRGEIEPVEKLAAQPPEGRLVDFEEEGEARVLTAEEDVEGELHELEFNRWLMATQCILGPLFCVTVLCSGMDNLPWLLLATGIAGLAVAILVAVFADHGNDAGARLARCFMGFFVAVVWIMAIADEVVNVLRTFGFIFGLSDAIIGLTIFAVGNSMADFVANISIAAFAPLMGFAACFGGPMLNILLGIGISGSYVIRATGEPYPIDFSATLLVSSIGLLGLLAATLVCVPINGFYLTRKWGIFLVMCYVVIMLINVLTEINRHRER